jgi:hypothetical protein
MTRDDLEHVWAWANDKLATGKEPPWAWDQYVKLCEVLDVISAEITRTMRTGLPRSMQREGTHLRLVADNRLAESAQHRSESGL